MLFTTFSLPKANYAIFHREGKLRECSIKLHGGQVDIANIKAFTSIQVAMVQQGK